MEMDVCRKYSIRESTAIVNLVHPHSLHGYLCVSLSAISSSLRLGHTADKWSSLWSVCVWSEGVNVRQGPLSYLPYGVRDGSKGQGLVVDSALLRLQAS